VFLKQGERTGFRKKETPGGSCGLPGASQIEEVITGI